jgi:biopolymer transport protein ExbD
MRIPSNIRSGEVGFNMTPMIDVVFLLIIFFLLSSHLAKQETQLPLPLPLADSSDKPVEDDIPRVTVNVLEDGALLLAGRRIEAAELQQRLTEKLASAGKDLQVRIRSDRAAPYRDVEPIMLACARAGIWNVTFAVFRSEDVR